MMSGYDWFTHTLLKEIESFLADDWKSILIIKQYALLHKQYTFHGKDCRLSRWHSAAVAECRYAVTSRDISLTLLQFVASKSYRVDMQYTIDTNKSTWLKTSMPSGHTSADTQWWKHISDIAQVRHCCCCCLLTSVQPDGYIYGRPQIKVHTDKWTQVYSAHCPLVVTHPSTNRDRRDLTTVNESLS